MNPEPASIQHLVAEDSLLSEDSPSRTPQALNTLSCLHSCAMRVSKHPQVSFAVLEVRVELKRKRASLGNKVQPVAAQPAVVPVAAVSWQMFGHVVG